MKCAQRTGGACAPGAVRVELRRRKPRVARQAGWRRANLENDTERGTSAACVRPRATAASAGRALFWCEGLVDAAPTAHVDYAVDMMVKLGLWKRAGPGARAGTGPRRRCAPSNATLPCRGRANWNELAEALEGRARGHSSPDANL